MSNEMFPRLMPIDIKFFSGESPSPQKLTGIFKYLYSAFYVLESFLGNGIGYRADSVHDRKMIFNISNSIGSMGKLYKPSNKLVSLQSIYRNYGAVNSYNIMHLQGMSGTDILHDNHVKFEKITDSFMHAVDDNEKSLIIIQPFNIPIDAYLDGDWTFGIEFRGKSNIIIYLNENEAIAVSDSAAPVIVLQNELSRHISTAISDTYVSHIEFTPEPGSQVEIFSVYLVKNDDTFLKSSYINVKPYNIAYALGTDNPTYFEVRKPCVNVNICNKATCQYCIGNTYDIYTRVNGIQPSGRPVCAGEYALGGKVNPSLIPNNGLTYVPDNETTIYTIQSPLQMISKPYLVKFAPFAIHNLTSGETIPKNQAVVYNILAGGGSDNPIKYNLPIQSAGRPDIVYVNDLNSEIFQSNLMILIIGGTYGITNLLQDMMKNLTEIESRVVSVYAD